WPVPAPTSGQQLSSSLPACGLTLSPSPSNRKAAHRSAVLYWPHRIPAEGRAPAMHPSTTWRFPFVTPGFPFVVMNAIPVPYIPGFHGPLLPGPLSILFLLNMLAGMAIMAYGFISPVVMFPDQAPQTEE